jgi:anti-sigma28 factor (negative regulator of flagellin synthesis)
LVKKLRCTWHRLERDNIMQTPDITNIARPESVVLLAAQVRAAREMLRRDRIDGLKERVSEGGYAVSSKDLAQRVLLSTRV